MPPPTATRDIRAAGGVVWRLAQGERQVALVHRPRYDDWTLPKGKLLPGEWAVAGAVREVEEELGSRVAVSRRIGTVGYDVPDGRKIVTYWVMQHLDGTFTAGDEVDDVRWLRPKAARELLSYDVDRRVMSDFVAVPVPDSVLLLVRHAKAGKRREWRGDDDLRPLEPAGVAQAQRLVDLLAMFAPDHIVSAEPLRCVQSVEPLAEKLDLPVRVDPVFGDRAFGSAPGATEDALLALAKPGRVTVVCSQGLTIPGLIDRFGRGVLPSDTRKAALWVLTVVDGAVVSTDYYEDAVR